MSQWQIKVPDHFDIASLSKWANNCIYEGVPRGIISFALLSHHPADKDLKQLEALNQVEHSITREMSWRNHRGSELEKSGSVDQAIPLYEGNLADWFSGEVPYDRLRIIYTKEGQVSEALRVCEAFVRMAEELIALGSPRGDLPIKRDRFAGYARKLKKDHGLP
jgi:hypothetical protein